MIRLEISSLEDTKDKVSVLSEGNHIIGRGILNCHDKRISRKHALISINKNVATIKSMHVNPCFLKAKEGIITILPKDTSVVLNDGDQFAFLASQFWFEVKIIKDERDINTLTLAQDEVMEEMICHDNFKEEKNNFCKNMSTSSTSRHSLNDDELEVILKRQKTKDADTSDSKPVLMDLDSKTDTAPVGKTENLLTHDGLIKVANIEMNCVELEDNNMVNETQNHENNMKHQNAEKNNEGVGNIEGTSNGTNENKASHSKDDSKEKCVRRKSCWYGLNCYRKNPIHRADFSHPGDDDFEASSNQDQPLCPFGSACYRKNKHHRKYYKHSGLPTDEPSSGAKGRQKYKRPSKERVNTVDLKHDTDSDNSSDYDDPFATDASSDDFQLSDDDYDDDDSTDSEDSQKVEEEISETKKLLKEAKKFVGCK